MLDVLNAATFKLLILVGDIFQIESILFGNWFGVAKAVVPQSAISVLEQPYRIRIKIYWLFGVKSGISKQIF